MENERRHRKLLVIAASDLDHALTLIPALETLKQKRPGIQIDLLAPGLFPLQEAYRSVVNLIDPAQLQNLDKKQRFNWLKSQGYQWVWNTESLPSPWHRIIEVVKHPGWISTPSVSKWPGSMMMNLRRKQLAQLFREVDWISAPLLELSLEQAGERQQFLSELPPGKVIGLELIASKEAIFSPKQYHELITQLLNRPNIMLLLFLNPDHPFPVKAIPKHQQISIVKESLQHLIPKLAACDLLIGSSGLYHLAFALRFPVIGLFKNRKAKRMWHYRVKRAKAIVPFRGKMRSVKPVLRAVNSLLKQTE